jgi:hypothetical protein
MSTFEGVRTYQGSCHCGAVRFEADLDLGRGTSQCNCTYCAKADAFRLLSGREHLIVRDNPQAERPRCASCGIMPFGHGNVPEIGGEYYSVNMRCLDGLDLTGVRVKYLDGLHDTWALVSEAPWVNPWEGAGAPGLKPAWETGEG